VPEERGIVSFAGVLAHLVGVSLSMQTIPTAMRIDCPEQCASRQYLVADYLTTVPLLVGTVLDGKDTSIRRCEDAKVRRSEGAKVRIIEPVVHLLS
jgi:hypothetical protein